MARDRADNQADALIVGAGMAGLMAGRALAGRGASVILLDRRSSLGGRLATRSIGPGRADHGAQFLTAESPLFRRIVRDWQREGVVQEWCTGWSEGSIIPGRTQALVRWAAPGGMAAFTEHLARGLDARTGSRVTRIATTGDGRWEVGDARDVTCCARVLLMTPPVPESLDLLELADIPLPDEEYRGLRRVTYTRCVVGIFRYDGNVDIPEPGLVEGSDGDIAFIADNRRKGVSPGALVVTVQAGTELSEELFETPREAALDRLEQALAPYRSRDAVLRERQIKRWRYAIPRMHYPERALRLVLGRRPPLVLAGDGFGGMRVEGAALSGLHAAELAAAAL